MNISQRLALAILAGLMFLPGVAAAQTTGLKIGYVNVQRVFADSPQLQAARLALQEEFSPRQRELVAQQKALQEKQAQLQRDMEVMGAEERTSAQREIRKQERELVRANDEFNEDVNLRQNDMFGKVQRALQLQIQAFAVQAGYDLILGEGVVYVQVGGPLDITQQVIDSLQNAGAGAQ